MRWIRSLLFGGLSCLAMDASGQSILFVDRAVWTDSVDRDNRTFAGIYQSPISAHRKVFLWTQLRGTRELLERLRRRMDGSISIRHNWYRYDSDSVYEDASVRLEVGRKADLQKLEYQLDAAGAFTWRVWSTRDGLSRGNWRVDVVWDDGQPIACTTQSGEEEPCSYFLEIK